MDREALKANRGEEEEAEKVTRRVWRFVALDGSGRTAIMDQKGGAWEEECVRTQFE